MQYRKCIALFAAALVGFGVIAADAATVTSVTITSPDSGDVLGIDSTFTVTAVVEDFSPEDTDGIVMYLFSGADSVLVASTATNASLNDSNGTAISLHTIIDAKAGRKVAGATGGTATTAFIAVAFSRGGTSGAPSAAASTKGDADSVRVTTSSTNLEQTTYTWHGKVHGASGTVSNIRAAAIAFDRTENSNSALKESAATLTFGVDGDRPTDADRITTTVANVGLPVGTPNTYSDLGAGASSQVLGIGDTVKVQVKLGGVATSVLASSSTLTVQANMFGKNFPITTTGRALDTLKFTHVIAEGDFGDLAGTNNSAGIIDTVTVYIVDAAGNRSGSTDAALPTGVTVQADFFVDGKAPVLDAGVVAGDTILPVSGDTITDGSSNTGTQVDLNQLTYTLAEALDSLKITFVNGDKSTLLKIGNAGTAADAALGKGDTNTVNFTSYGDTAVATWITVDGATFAIATQDTAVKVITGVQDITFRGQDLAGNWGPTLTRTGVYVDVDNVEFKRLFPTAANALDTLEQETAKVVFQLSETADSVRINYANISGNDTKARTRLLVGSELTSSLEQVITVDSLVTGTKYALTIESADLAGNYSITAPDTFIYDTTFVVPVIASFTVKASTPAPNAGDTVTVTLTARTEIDCVAVTYKEAAILRLTGGSNVTVWGTGVAADAANAGRFTLNADDWVTGARTVKLSNTHSIDSITVSVADCTDTTKLYVGKIASAIVYGPAALDKILMAAGGDTIGQGDATWISVVMADKFGNNTAADAHIEIATNAIGVDHPVNAIEINKGAGGFWINANGYAGDLTLTARAVVGAAGVLNEEGVLTVFVSADGATVLDDPDTLAAEDYMGADGLGDQGGFVLLTWPASDDHATLSGYRIYREITVTTDVDANGALVALAEPTLADVAWASVDAVPGQDVVRAIVATLDGVESFYSVAAERGGLSSSKVAFDAAATVAAPYELMAEAMQNSREVAQLDLNAPVFAALSPEALAFDETGVAPRFKVVDGTMLSNLTRSADAVRAIDNIAPEAVAFLQAIDTPNDLGSSVTVQWAKSASDQMLTVVNSPAVGPNNMFQTAGVAGYNVYRKVNDGAFQLVGKANAGETSLTDQTVFNGVRYTYSVAPYDTDNESVTVLENSAMAIRNNAVAADGTPVLGLFGADSRVDYDDFFIFADHFGLSAGAEAFEPAFDLSPNNQIDLDDFFVFADNFGKTIQAAGKVVPTMAGLNSDASFFLNAGLELPRVGEDMSVAVSLEEFVEVKAYGLTVSYDADVLEFVGTSVEDNILGETQLATPQAIARGEGEVYIAAFGDVASEGNLGLGLIFRARTQIEDSYIEISSGAIQDGGYGINQITTPASVRIETRPDVYALQNNYPNPFNPETTIKYQLPEAGEVTLEVYNMLGQVVNTLVSEYQTAGRYVYQWDATNSNGQSLSSGVYFYRINADGEFQSIKKMLLLK